MLPDPEPAGAASVLRADLDACEERMAQEAAGIEAKVQLVSDETGESGSDAVSKSNATTEPEASPPSSTPDDAPCEIEEVPDDGVRYRCDGKCGFVGTFAEVATHELTCSVVLEQSAGRGNKGGRRETRYACDGECGFTGSYYEVAAHEATCPVAAKKSDSAGNQRQVRDVSVKQFRCDRQCGFTGSYDEVAAHEATCSFVAKTPGPESGAAGVKQFHCDGRCGFIGSFAEVAAHEATCKDAAAAKTTLKPLDVGSAGSAGSAQKDKTSSPLGGLGSSLKSMSSSMRGDRAPRSPPSQSTSFSTRAAGGGPKKSPAPVTDLPRTQDGGQRGKKFQCDGLCGFVGLYAEVAEHEVTCARRLEMLAGADDVKKYRCDGQCGHTGKQSSPAASLPLSLCLGLRLCLYRISHTGGVHRDLRTSGGTRGDVHCLGCIASAGEFRHDTSGWPCRVGEGSRRPCRLAGLCVCVSVLSASPCVCAYIQAYRIHSATALDGPSLLDWEVAGCDDAVQNVCMCAHQCHTCIHNTYTCKYTQVVVDGNDGNVEKSPSTGASGAPTPTQILAPNNLSVHAKRPASCQPCDGKAAEELAEMVRQGQGAEECMTAAGDRTGDLSDSA